MLKSWLNYLLESSKCCFIINQHHCKGKHPASKVQWDLACAEKFITYCFFDGFGKTVHVIFILE